MTGINLKPRSSPAVTRKRTLYAVLGMPPGSAPEELHRRYLELAVRLHPDKGLTDGEQFRELTAAWTVLKDPARRRRYDAQLLLEGGQCTRCEGSGRRYSMKDGSYINCPYCLGTGQEG